jgi:hypothetical protein
MYYFYMLVSKGIDKFTNKFCPDNAFGGSNPMHQMSTKATSKAFNITKRITGVNLASDIVKTQLGNKAQKWGRGAVKGVGQLAKWGVNKVRGKK